MRDLPARQWQRLVTIREIRGAAISAELCTFSIGRGIVSRKWELMILMTLIKVCLYAMCHLRKSKRSSCEVRLQNEGVISDKFPPKLSTLSKDGGYVLPSPSSLFFFFLTNFN